MQTNIGTIDRTIRIVAGLALITTVFVGPQNALGWIGLIPLVTALIGWCPAYTHAVRHQDLQSLTGLA